MAAHDGEDETESLDTGARASAERAQVNFRCRHSELSYWTEAAAVAGYGPRGFARWVKDVLTERAVAIFREHDNRYGGGKRP